MQLPLHKNETGLFFRKTAPFKKIFCYAYFSNTSAITGR